MRKLLSISKKHPTPKGCVMRLFKLLTYAQYASFFHRRQPCLWARSIIFRQLVMIICATGLSVAGSWFFMGFVSADSSSDIIHGPGPDKCPKSHQCSTCHVNDIFSELENSAHSDLSCFDCHIPGVVQSTKYERAERSFYHLGYHIDGDQWQEVNGNGVCLRCHEERASQTMSKTCWECHMAVDGTDEIVFPKVKGEPPVGDNIRAIKKVPHRSHYFKVH